jgi:hypothetical protein
MIGGGRVICPNDQWAAQLRSYVAAATRAERMWDSPKQPCRVWIRL